jgi:hypothetical protein
MLKIAPQDRGIPNQPWLSRRALWLHETKAKAMQRLLTPSLQLRVYMSSHARRARKLGKGGPSETVGALIDNTIRRIIHREVLPRAMWVIVGGVALSIVLAAYAVMWSLNHSSDLARVYVAARGLPLLSADEKRAGVTGQLIRKAGTAAKDSAKGRLLDWFRKKGRDEEPEQPE